jgi:group I intron endonuclease
MAYIYQITNLLNQKKYIGQTINPRRRFSQHSTVCSGMPISLAIIKYGVENFSFEIIEETDCPNEREIFWIDFFNTYEGSGYNATRGGEGAVKLDYQKIAKDYAVLKSVTKTAEANGCDRHSVSSALKALGIEVKKPKHEDEKHTAIHEEFLSGMEKEILAEKYSLAEGTVTNIVRKKAREEFWDSKNTQEELHSFSGTGRKDFAQKVTMFEKGADKALKVFDSQMDAARFLVENGYSESKNIRTISGKIGMACRGERKSAYKFRWEYA